MNAPSMFELKAANPIWEALTEEELQQAASEVEICQYDKNVIIHQEGTVPTHLMMLMSGKVKIHKEGVSQRQQIIRLLKPGDLFGYRCLIGGGVHGSCASTMESSVIYQLNKECFFHLLHQNSRFCFLVMQSMANDLGVQEVQTVNLTQKHIRGRLAESLLSLQQQYGMDEDDVTIAIYMSREDLANMSNMTTSNAIRTLSQFAQEGLISIDGRKIKLLQRSVLEKISRLG